MSWLKSKLGNYILSPERALEVSAKHVTSLPVAKFCYVCLRISCTPSIQPDSHCRNGRFCSSLTRTSFDERSSCIFIPDASVKRYSARAAALLAAIP